VLKRPRPQILPVRWMTRGAFLFTSASAGALANRAARIEGGSGWPCMLLYVLGGCRPVASRFDADATLAIVTGLPVFEDMVEIMRTSSYAPGR
jgi:hypothetical protein